MFLSCRFSRAEQEYTLTPEQGVTVTLSGLLPVGGHAEAETFDTDEEDVLHAYDITIYYRNGAEFEPKNDPIDVSFSSDPYGIGESITVMV